jgi:hypothetical protein
MEIPSPEFRERVDELIADLIKELVQRSDVIDVLASLPNLIDPLPAEHEDESAGLASEPPEEEYQLSL